MRVNALRLQGARGVVHVKPALQHQLHLYHRAEQRHAVRGILSDACPQQAVKEGVGGEEDIWEICWIFSNPSL